MSTSSWLTRAFLVIGLMLTVAGGLQAKPDFSDFGGRYQGTWLITASTTSIAAAVTGDAIPVKKGSGLTLDFSGILVAGTQSVAILSTLKFKAKRKLLASSVLMGFAGPVPTLPTRFGGSKKTLRFVLTTGPGAQLLGNDLAGTAIAYTIKFSKRKITILGTGSLVQGGSPNPVQLFITLNKRGGD